MQNYSTTPAAELAILKLVSTRLRARLNDEIEGIKIHQIDHRTFSLEGDTDYKKTYLTISLPVANFNAANKIITGVFPESYVTSEELDANTLIYKFTVGHRRESH